MLEGFKNSMMVNRAWQEAAKQMEQEERNPETGVEISSDRKEIMEKSQEERWELMNGILFARLKELAGEYPKLTKLV